jgi:hypothetical protein
LKSDEEPSKASWLHRRHSSSFAQPRQRKFYAAIQRSIETDSQVQIAAGVSGATVLEAIEKIQTAVFALTEKCLESEKLSVPLEDASALSCAVSDILNGV